MSSSTQSTSWHGVAYGLCLACFAAYQQFKLPPMLPSLLESYGYDLTVAGGFMSIYALMGLLLSLALGHRIQREGAVRAVQGGLILTVIGNVAMLVAPEQAWLVLAARALEGIAFAVFAITGPVIVTKSAHPRHLPLLVALVASWIPVGQLTAAGLAPLSAELGGWRFLWWVALVLCAGLALWTRSLSGAGGPLRSIAEAGTRRRDAGPDRRARIGLILTAAVFMLWSGQYFAYMTWLPQYLVEAQGLDPGLAAAGYALPVFVLLVFNLVTGAALKSGASLGALLLVGLALQVGVWWLLPSTGGGWAGIASLVVYGMGAGITPTCLFAMPAAILGPGRGTGRAYGIVMTGRNLGVLIGPILLPGVLRLTGSWVETTPTFMAITLAALLLAVALAIRGYRI